MNQVERILNGLAGVVPATAAGKFLTNKPLSLLISDFYDELMNLKPLCGKKQVDSDKLQVTVTSSFCKIDKHLSTARNAKDGKDMSAITILIISVVCREFIESRGEAVQRQLASVLDENTHNHNPESDDFLRQLSEGISKNFIYSQADADDFCETWFDCSLNDKARDEMIRLLKQNHWIKKPRSFLKVFGRHSVHFKIYWEAKCLTELVYFFDRFEEIGIIKVRGNKGCWRAIEVHLYDLKGNKYMGRLREVSLDFKNNMALYPIQIEKVDHLIKWVLKEQNGS
jgi:hypothetical protein